MSRYLVATDRAQASPLDDTGIAERAKHALTTYADPEARPGAGYRREPDYPRSRAALVAASSGQTVRINGNDKKPVATAAVVGLPMPCENNSQKNEKAASLAQAAPIPGQGTWETTLQGRDLDGNFGSFEAYYDTVLDIT